jgi:hypothetical protein
LRKNQNQELKMAVPKTRPGGRIVIRSPDDIQKALARRINRILSDQGEDHHGGQLAALCNSWINAEKWKVEVKDLRELQEQVQELQEQLKDDRHRRY